MQAVPPALLELSLRLRQLRVDHWPDSRLTQGALARALAGDESLSPAAVASWENRAAPKLPPRERVRAYAQFFATRRSVESEPRLIPLNTFTDEERAVYDVLEDELLRLHAAARGNQFDQIVARRSWHFDDSGPVTLVCPNLPSSESSPLADLANPNYTELLSFADTDSLVELFGHVRAENPTMQVTFKSAQHVVPDDLSGHVAIIGGIGWNEVTRRILELAQLPVTQREDPEIESGEIFVARVGGRERKFLPRLSASGPPRPVEDIGLLVRMPNPLNSSRTLTMCNGIHASGVLGAVRSLTDARLREANERYIAQHFPGPRQQFGILTRVQVIEGRALTPDFSIPGTVLYQWPAESDTQAPAGSAGTRG